MKKKVADFVIDHIADEGIEDVFVVYGAANGHLIDAFTRNDKTRYVAVMHEQAGGFAAEGYAKVSGKFGVSIATSGPGGMNFVTPIGNCFYDSVPCVFITGQIKTQYMRPNESIRQIGFQETDIVSIVEPITKYAKLVDKPEDIRYELEKAIHIATSGRPGPVLLDLPIDVAKTEVDVGLLRSFETEQNTPTFDIEKIDLQIDKFLVDLKNSKRPCLMIGAGVKLAGADELFFELGRKLKVPCFPTWNALDTVCSDYEYYGGRIGTYGGAGRNFGIQNSDLILAIGSRISGRITGGEPSTFAREAKKYMVDIDAANLVKKWQQLPFDECIHSDAKLFIERLNERLDYVEYNDANYFPDFSSWMNKVIEWKEKYDPVTTEMFEENGSLHPYAFTRILSEEMKSNDILVGDCGGNIVVLNHAFETKIGQRYYTNNGNSPMGFSFAGAMGGWFAADDDQNVVCVIGDGGFNMNIQELQTLLNYNVKLKTIILNNHIYGITKAFQEVNFEGRSEACGPKGYSPPDFVAIADAYNVPTMTITGEDTYDQVRAKIRDFLDFDGPMVCDVDCHEYHTYEPKIVGWATPVEDMYPYLPREEFYENMIVKPMEISKNPPMPSIFDKDGSSME
jgi:acetolactate synthase-1/2/3 large subunit